MLKDLKKDLATEGFGSQVDFELVNHDTWHDRFYVETMQHKAGDNLKVIQDEDDNVEMHIWRKFGAEKDDVYIIDSEGKIAKFFAKPASDLTKQNVKNALLDVLNHGSPCA